MRKTFFIISALSFAFAMLLGSFDVYSMESNTDIPISLRRSLSNASQNPEAPRSLVIEAYYDSDLSSVSAFLNDVGLVVDVYLENLDTEEEVHYQIPGSGSSIMPISGTSGCWRITFILSNGDGYIGEFYVI